MQKVDTKKFGVHSGRQVHNPFAAPVMQFWALGSMGGTAARFEGVLWWARAGAVGRTLEKQGEKRPRGEKQTPRAVVKLAAGSALIAARPWSPSPKNV